jgi:hypothetical protein
VLLVVPVKRITGVSGFMDAVSLTFSIYGGARHALVTSWRSRSSSPCWPGLGLEDGL